MPRKQLIKAVILAGGRDFGRWPDEYFDVVYSNAVIEHVGAFAKQKRMAAEILRVGKRRFVTTPNRWFPFEFHLRRPFVTWLPAPTYLYAGRIIRSHPKTLRRRITIQPS